MPWQTDNSTVIVSFLKGMPASGYSLRSDGQRLYSYAEVIGQWVQDSSMRLVWMPTELGRNSRTTSKHRGMLRRQALAAGITINEYNANKGA